MSAREQVRLSMGLLADDFDAQLASQGISYPEAARDHVEHLTLDMRAVSRLRCRGVITDSAADRAYDRIAKKLWKAVGL